MPGYVIQLLLLGVIIVSAMALGYGAASTDGSDLMFAGSAGVLTGVLGLIGSEHFKPLTIGSIKAFINGSDIPMYYMDSKSYIIHANQEVCRLLDIGEKKLIGMHIDRVILIAAARHVVESEKSRFIKEQNQFVKDVEEEKERHLQTTIKFHEKSTGDEKTVWIHADILYKNKKRYGSLVLFHQID
ncbi:MAG: hypothetical protein B6D76_03570 [gamma proteobacterium symbiont of Stewartia floridana]|nr:MAG: hypothetical protein B6D76_03570 [gamma proteobacterium symbiont of Stewartia floridana]RLW58992.1 MAG: hypothetical protein B6D75_11990 [gamma proteobacterium symbiont of Stewartia floridana]